MFVWGYFFDISRSNVANLVNFPAFILALASFATCLISYLKAPDDKKRPIVAFSIFVLNIILISILTIINGRLDSPFIYLWIIISLFGPIFGIWGTLTVLAFSTGFTIFDYLNVNPFEITRLISIASLSILPLLAGIIIWREKTIRDETDNDSRAFKNLANELNAVANKSEIVINAIGDGVIAVDGQGIIQLINPAAQTIIGWPKQDALTLNYRSILKLVNPDGTDVEPSSDPIEQVLNSNQQIRSNNLTLMTKTGKKIIVSLMVSPVGDIGSGAIAVFHDVTKERAEEREQAEFISTASHEMRTPVASIEGYLGLALNPQTAQIDVRARDYILKAHASAEHLGHLFQDLLDVSKADDGRISNNPKVVNIIKFTNDILQGLEKKAQEKGLDIIFKPIPKNTIGKVIAPEYSVNSDNDHIREILNNLVENAIKYTQRGEILIDVTGDEDRVVISVKDSGIGIPAEDLPHLFQKFYRVDNKDTREIGGTGLGLYLSRRLAELMGGRIWVESIYGSGSTFFLELPRVSSQEAIRLAEEQESSINPKNNIFTQQTNTETIDFPETNQELPIEQPIATTQNEPIVQPLTVTQNQTQTVSVPQRPPQPISTNTQKIKQPSFSVPTPTTQLHPLPENHTPNNVPRGQALTPQQIAAYVTKQRQLAQQEREKSQDRSSSASISIPNR